jgi:hypothetical protein
MSTFLQIKPAKKQTLPEGKRRFATNLSLLAWDQFRNKAKSLGMPMSALLEIMVILQNDPVVEEKIQSLKKAKLMPPP